MDEKVFGYAVLTFISGVVGASLFGYGYFNQVYSILPFAIMMLIGFLYCLSRLYALVLRATKENKEA